ncbi:hypothetical protein AMTR_s00011p00232270, partial [Amborella trichopoda]
DCHDTLWAGHPGTHRRPCFWGLLLARPRMMDDVEEYVLSNGSKKPPEACSIGKSIASCISHPQKLIGLDALSSRSNMPAHGHLSNEWDDHLNNFSIRLLPG